MAPRGRRELEECWRQRVKNARASYDRASARHKRMLKELAHMAPADGLFAVAQARREEVLALKELTRTTRLSADLVLNGKMPPRDEKVLI